MLNLLIPGIIISSVIFAAIIVFWYLNQPSIATLLKQEISKAKMDFQEIPSKVITENDIERFPEIIQRFLKFAGVIGKEIPNNFAMSLTGKFRTKPNQPWFKATSTQFNYLSKPTRLFIIRLRLFAIFSMTGKDIYANGRGYMKGNFMRLKEIFDEKGEEFDIGEFTIFLNDILLVCPAGLITIKSRLEWTEIDETTVEVKLSDKTQSVKAKLFFEPSGKLVNFKTNDRFFDEKDEQGNVKYVRKLWSTPIDNYRKVGGYNLPHQVRAIWHLESGEFCYADFILEKIIYNVSSGFFS